MTELDPIGERAAFHLAAQWFSDAARRAGGRLDEPGLGEWSVRGLVGHTSRALATLRSYLTDETGGSEVDSPAAYFRLALQASPATIADRGRAAGQELGEDPARAVATMAADVRGLVDAASDEAIVLSPVGRMRLVDYLPTRTFELTVHTCDLLSALGERPEPPRPAAASALRVAAALASEGPDAGELLLALTGRGPLRPGFTVL